MGKKILNGWTWKTVGKRAMEIGFCMGKVACPHCGTLMSGIITTECGWCGCRMFLYKKGKEK